MDVGSYLETGNHQTGISWNEMQLLGPAWFALPVEHWEVPWNQAAQQLNSSSTWRSEIRALQYLCFLVFRSMMKLDIQWLNVKTSQDESRRVKTILCGHWSSQLPALPRLNGVQWLRRVARGKSTKKVASSGKDEKQITAPTRRPPKKERKESKNECKNIQKLDAPIVGLLDGDQQASPAGVGTLWQRKFQIRAAQLGSIPWGAVPPHCHC